MEEDERGPLFDRVIFAVIPSEDLTDDEINQITATIVSGGGEHEPLNEDGSIAKLPELTHIISTTIEFPEYLEAVDLTIPVVKPTWVQTSVQKLKLSQTRQFSPDPNQFFHDVVLTTANLPDGDREAIIAGVIAFGGQASGPLTRLTTHVVTSSMDHEKCRVAVEKGLKCKIVLPHWFQDCVRLGNKIREQPYMFPDPELFKAHNLAPPKGWVSDDMEGATVAYPAGMPLMTPPGSPSDIRKNLSAFMSKKIYFADDLSLGSRLRQTLEGVIRHGGGTLTENVSDADIYVGQFRDGQAYLEASWAGKEVANLSWLYNVIKRNRYTSPTRKLLHYPVPRNGLPGFEDQRISISNYSGEARIYVENLIRHCGATFTKTLKQTDTFLVTAHRSSEKCEAAEEWNINIISHLWLEESYAKCAMQSLTNPRYTAFPARTNLSEVCGMTPIDMKRVEHFFFPKPSKSVSKPTSPQKPSPRKTVPASSAFPGASTAAKGTVEQTEVPWPIPEVPTPAAGDADTETEEDEEPEPEPQTTKKPKGRPPRTSATPRHFPNKENESPLARSSSRASKTKALGALHMQADDIALFQREMKRKGGVLHGGRKSGSAEDLSSPAPALEEPQDRKKKRASDEMTYEVTAVGSDLSDGETQKAGKPAKKARTSQPSKATLLPTVQYRMMVTGDERWLKNANQESADKAKLRHLGVLLTQEAKDVDILVAPRIMRTRKFVAALASAPLVVDASYLDHALKKGKLIDNPSLLEDKDTEERFGFKLSKSLERAKTNNRNLFRGWSIFVTRNIAGGFDTYKEFITINGGSPYAYNGRSGVTIKPRLKDDPEAGAEVQNQGDEDEFDYVYLVSGDSAEDKKLWKPFRELAKKQDLKARVVNQDWLLNAAMSQEIRWDKKWEREG